MTASSPTTSSPCRSMISRSTPCVDGWFGPKLMRITSSFVWSDSGMTRRVGTGEGIREPSYCAPFTIGQARVCLSGAIVTVSVSLGVREADGLAAERIVLAQRVPFPVVVHDQALQVRVAVEADCHQVELLALVPVGGRTDGD